MLKTYLVDMLVRKITKKEINSKTKEAYKVTDIKIQEYRVVVQSKLDEMIATEIAEKIIT